MCGILGFIGAVDKELFKAALDKISHRGPDGYGIWADGTIHLGHRRLSIIDLSDRATQPMEIFERFVISFNGEIYNYKELRKELESKGCQFKSDSDTEVLLYAYIQWGEKCLAKFNGMWAFAIWDKQEKQLFLSRDRVGKKPLFYSDEADFFAFASEMKALYPFLKEITIRKEIVEKAKADTFSYESTVDSLINGIKRFPAGSYGVLKNNRLHISKFWFPLEEKAAVSNRYEEQVEQFRELFLDACRLRMRSDVAIGTALSGGLDSSATICGMARIGNSRQGDFHPDWQHAFVACFKGSAMDERVYAEKVVNHLGIKATFLEIDPLKDIESIFHYLYQFEELYLTSPIPFVQLYGQIKKEGVTVTLDGHGADELFGGYPNTLLPATIDAFPNYIKQKKVFDTVVGASHGGNLPDYKRELINTLKYSAVNRLHKLYPKDKSQLNLQKKVDGLDYLNSKLFELTYETILPTLLRNYDRYSMINGVEIRMPFLDYRILNFAFSIPYSSKIRNGYTKNIIRDALKDVMPQEITYRKNKIGFNTPFAEWIRGPLKTWILDIVHSAGFKQSELVQAEKIRANLTTILHSQEANYFQGEKLWIDLMPYLWEKSLRLAYEQ
jgi:asparagine synthase (glutamine-hydrolysing)